jgi:hypothetical protein
LRGGTDKSGLYSSCVVQRFVLLEHITPDVTSQRDDLVEAVGNVWIDRISVCLYDLLLITRNRKLRALSKSSVFFKSNMNNFYSSDNY